MPEPQPPSVTRVLLRALRERCPACGVGEVFETRLAGRSECPACGWRLERCDGHWMGGSEINMIVTFPTSALTFIAVGAVFGMTSWTILAGCIFTVLFGYWIFRRSRCLFYAVDYLVDPTPDEPPPTDRERLLRDGPGTPPPPNRPRSREVARSRKTTRSRKVKFLPRSAEAAVPRRSVKT